MTVDTTYAKQLWNDTLPLADKSLYHPFVQGLGDGSLSTDRYRGYIAQDAFYLEVFARGYAYCLAQSPDREGVHSFHRLLNGVFEELELHRGVAAKLDIDLDSVEPVKACKDYTDFLREGIESSAPIGEILAGMTPCMRLYQYVGESLAAAGNVGDEYRDWVESYSGDEMKQLADLIDSLLGRYAEKSDRERERFVRAMELEFDFFDSAWRLGAD